MYIDTHIHFWDRDHLQYDWLDGVPAISKRHDPQVLSEASAGLGLEKIVFVQADCLAEQGIEEVRWVSKLAESDPRIKGIVAFAPVDQTEKLPGYLSQLQAFPLVKGVRNLIQGKGQGFCNQPAFIEGVGMLADYGWRFDLCFYHPQFLDALELVASCPETFFILDHLGKPDIRHGLMEPWATHIKTLAGFPNVAAKISGMVTEADRENWVPADLQPYFDHMVDCFGPDRLMFGGDWPVNELATPYRNWVETARAGLKSLSAAEQHQVFYQNAIRYYQLA